MRQYGKLTVLMITAVIAGLSLAGCEDPNSGDDSGGGSSGAWGELMGIEVLEWENSSSDVTYREAYQGMLPGHDPNTAEHRAFLQGLRIEVVYKNKIVQYDFPDGWENFKAQKDPETGESGAGESPVGNLVWNDKAAPMLTVDISVKANSVTKHAYVTVQVKPIRSFTIVPPQGQSLTGFYRLGISADDETQGINAWFASMINAGTTINARYDGNVTKKITKDGTETGSISFNNVKSAIEFLDFDKDVVGKQAINMKLYDVTTTNKPIQAVVLPVLSRKDKNSAEYTAMQRVSGGEVTGPKGSGAFASGGAAPYTPPYYMKTFSMGKYEIPYALWYGVGQWAVKRGYWFKTESGVFGIGQEGSNFGSSAGAPPQAVKEDATSDFQPAMGMTWLEAAVWCNAYTELMNESRKGASGELPLPPAGHDLANAVTPPSSDLGYVYVMYTNNAGATPQPLKYATTQSGTLADPNPQSANLSPAFVIDHAASGYRLPDEAEWEWAARGGQYGTDAWNYTYAGSNYSEKVAQILREGVLGTQEIGGLDPVGGINTLYLYDMTGNVWELCIKFNTILAGITSPSSPRGQSSPSLPTPAAGYLAPNGLTGIESFAVAKGGSFQYREGDNALKLDSSSQSGLNLYASYGNSGFRIVKND
ncbi:MAG: formylglycine-generating enzyme family protein [Spirochaetaceae bacterium]|nr:formylglycine-generating enzyme family protein [Spirochaetaceae bacterium]